ncbi:MAG: hypothetical protein P4L99_29330 [Chthoniobacter sp.]|nr:hypothetical protein [Chthoniobacter sp.]
MIKRHAPFLTRQTVRLRPKFGQPSPGQRRVFRLEGAFDLLAPDLEKGEIRAVTVPVKTFGNLGKCVRAIHLAAQTTGLLKQVTSTEKRKFKLIVSCLF